MVSGRARRDGSAAEAWIVGGFQHGRCLLREGSGGRCRYAWTRSSPSPPPSPPPSPSPPRDRRRVHRRWRRPGCRGCRERTANRPAGRIDRHPRHRRQCCCRRLRHDREREHDDRHRDRGGCRSRGGGRRGRRHHLQGLQGLLATSPRRLQRRVRAAEPSQTTARRRRTSSHDTPVLLSTSRTGEEKPFRQ